MAAPTSEHKPIKACPGYGDLACVACSEKVDRCVPWPCEFVTSDV